MASNANVHDPPPPPPPTAATVGGSNLTASPVPSSSIPTRQPHQPSPLSQTQASTSSIQVQPPPPTQNAASGPHLLSLKVMRASAPSLAVSEKPFFDHQPSSDPLINAISQGITTSLSIDPLSNYQSASSSSSSKIESKFNSAADNFPISNLLLLPQSFGTLFLGETFRTYLCVRNESDTVVREPSLRVEMQVGSSETNEGRWHQLAHVILPQPSRYSPDLEGGENEEKGGKAVWELDSKQPLQTTLSYDIKDLGPHVLVCTVGYKAFLGEKGEWVERSFRKYYKFSVDRSPISVRTKVHQCRYAGSRFHPERKVREKVELEVQVQNVGGGGNGLVLDGMKLKCRDGWRWSSVDRPAEEEVEGGEEGKGDMWRREDGKGSEILGDGDIRQYLFTLVPIEGNGKEKEKEEEEGIDLGTTQEGYVIKGDALGSLDISWRMSLGEPGRLQTSQLVRRRVLVPPVSVTGSSGSGFGFGPKLRTELTLLPSALAALQKVTPGDKLELGIKITVKDISGLHLPSPPTPPPPPAATEIEMQKDDDNDDTPLSEIASSPKISRSNTTNGSSSDLEIITIKRKLHIAIQHCSISSSPPPPTTSSISATVSSHEVIETSSTTPKKPSSTTTTSTSSKTSTPLNFSKTRLQTNLSNLVRNSSLSSTFRSGSGSQRGSIDIDDNISSVKPPPPPPPPKKEEEITLPEPKINWKTVSELYSIYLENHGQALNSISQRVKISNEFLPTQDLFKFQGESLIKMDEIEVEVKVQKCKKSGMMFCLKEQEQEGGDKMKGEIETQLVFKINDNSDNKVVRFGGLRILLLSYEEDGGRKIDCYRSILELPVFAETIISSD